jgi:hypothetical protein
MRENEDGATLGVFSSTLTATSIRPRRAERSLANSNILLLLCLIYLDSQYCAEQASHFTRRAKGRPLFVRRVPGMAPPSARAPRLSSLLRRYR